MPSGYNVYGDILTKDASGRDLNLTWNEFQATLTILNRSRAGFAAHLSHLTTDPFADVVQATLDASFEDASEFGEPVGVRTKIAPVTVGFNFKWRDLAARYTWMFLAHASTEQIQMVHNSALEADNRQVFLSIMGALFNNTARTSPESGGVAVVKPLWNGDGVIPPATLSQTFDGSHTHYLTSGAATIDPGDVEVLMDHVLHHDYGSNLGERLLLFANRAQTDVIRGFRVGQGTPAAKFDFIPATDAVAFLSDQQIIGDRPPGTFNGLKVIGSYGQAWIVEEPLMPAGYLLVAATSGPNSSLNPVGFRESADPALRGLLMPKGRDKDYPLIDAMYLRGFGTGIRHRGAAAVMQVTAGSYTVPAVFTGHP